MNRFAITVSLLTAWLWLSAAPTSALAAPAASRDADAVKSLDLKRFELAVAGDVDGLAKLLADDLTYTHSSGALDDKSKFLESLKSGKLKYTSIEPSDVQARAYGSTAVVIGQVKVALVSGGQPKDMVLRFLDVWTKRAGKWQMVAWQSTKLP